MKKPRPTRTSARFAAGLPLIVAPLLFAAPGPAHAEPGPPFSGPCAGVAVPEGSACVPEPKQCFVAPCPQYAIVPVAPEPDFVG
ncbi:hypothetical protein AMK16_01465 [Streptomyces sp. CB00455]|uniref:hypothetical protein n=1 Tax=Streptomyces sp. CB00455 TaxID=1703927 RepID=UPI00095D46A0|nr:hypothetical protein [Streptomyces sp. CB00455]OKK21942.1 hypothetical protein AMK16_01465 [Streptomyces sp. CB00455]